MCVCVKQTINQASMSHTQPLIKDFNNNEPDFLDDNKDSFNNFISIGLQIEIYGYRC